MLENLQATHTKNWPEGILHVQSEWYLIYFLVLLPLHKIKYSYKEARYLYK